MDDARYIYNQDMKERKAEARGVHGLRGKVMGRKGMKTSYDYMSKKERAALNGPVTTYSMNSFYTFDEFTQFPEDIQVQYLNHLINKYGTNLTRIGLDLFQMKSPTALYKHCVKFGYISNLNIHKGSQMKKSDRDRWENDVLEWMCPSAKPAVDDSENESKQASTSDCHESQKVSLMSSATFVMNEIDPAFLKMIRNGFGSKVRITITFEELG